MENLPSYAGSDIDAINDDDEDDPSPPPPPTTFCAFLTDTTLELL